MKIILLLAVLGAISLGLHLLGLRRRWYETQGGYWWFDDLAHFVSGFGVAAYTLVVFDPLGALIAFWWLALLWEVAEYIIGTPEDMWVSPKNMFYDLVLGTLGAITSIVLLSEFVF